MVELWEDDDTEAESWPVLARETTGDRILRAGCGAILAGLIVVALLIYGGLDVFGWPGALVLGAAFIGVCGVLCGTYGNQVVRTLLKVVKWL